MVKTPESKVFLEIPNVHGGFKRMRLRYFWKRTIEILRIQIMIVPTKIKTITTDDFFNVNGEWDHASKVEMKLQITIRRYGSAISTEGKQGVEHKPWTFVDELIIE